MSKKQLVAIAGLLFATAAWGSTFFIVKLAIAEIDLYYFLFLRFLFAALIMFIIFRKKMVRAVRPAIIPSVFVGFFLVAGYITQTEGLRFTSAANSALITCVYMVLIPIFYALLGKGRTSWVTYLGIVLAIAGMYLLTCFGLTGINRGDLITLMCAVSFALHIIFNGQYAAKLSLTAFVTLQFLLSSILCGAISAFRGGFTLHISRTVFIALAVTTLLSTVAAFLLQTSAQRVLPPARTGIILSMEAVFGALFAWTLGKEVPTWISFAGACVMVAGMLVSELGALRESR